MLGKSYYLKLGIPRSASAAGVRQAFREQAKRYHPDRVGTERVGFFQQLVEAYHTLSDPGRRQGYDRGLEHAEAGAAGEAATVSLDRASDATLPQIALPLRRPYLKAAPFEAALARVSRNLTTARFDKHQAPEPLQAQLILSAAEAMRGGTMVLVVPSCSPCERCGGSGRRGLFPCDLCDGEGLMEEEETLRVHIPPQAGDATRIDVPLPGLGLHDFYLCLRIRVGM
jgi:DnaJ-class molecular chaperone